MASQFDGWIVSDILKRKVASIRYAPLPPGAPSWESISYLTWEQLEDAARQNKPGFKVLKKLLTDKRFDR